MSPIREKVFIEALKHIRSDRRKVNSLLKDKRLSLHERIILECWLILPQNKYQDIIDRLATISNPSALIEGQKNLLLALAFNNHGKANQSILYLEKAIEQFRSIEANEFLFDCHGYLFLAHLNLKASEKLSDALKGMSAIGPSNRRQEIELERAWFNYYSYANNFEQAKSILSRLKKKNSEMTDSQQVGFLIDQFDFHIKQEQFVLASVCLEEIKRFKNFNFSSNFQYMRLLLDYIHKDQTLYVPEYKFEKNSIIHHQLKVIQLLSTETPTQARHYWDLLQAQSPEVYHNQFRYNGDTCLFSIALKKALRLDAGPIEVIREINNQDDLILKTLQDSNFQVRKDELYQIIWGTLPVEKKDYQKLEKAISRLRKKYLLDIRSRLGTYYLASPLKKTS